MQGFFSRSNMLLWAYRGTLIGSIWGVLFGLNITYVDIVEGQTSRAAGGVALCVSSVVLGVCVIAWRRQGRRHRATDERLSKAERHIDKLAKFALALPKDLEHKLSSHMQAQLHQTLQDIHDAIPDTMATKESHPHREVLADGALRSAAQLLTAGFERPVDRQNAYDLRRWRELVQLLQELDKPDLANRLGEFLPRIEEQVKRQLRQEYISAVRGNHWITALDVGQQIRNLFEGSELARDAELLEPRISQRIQQQIERRRVDQLQDETESRLLAGDSTPHADSDKGVSPSEKTSDGKSQPQSLRRMQLQLADEIAKTG